MNPTQATAIINEAKTRKLYDAPMPEDESKRISEAENIVKDAEIAEKAGLKKHKDAIDAILFIARLPEPEQPKFNPVTQKLEETEPSPASSSQPEPQEVTESAPSSSSSSSSLDEAPAPTEHSLHSALVAKQQAIARLKKERLPIPPELEGDPPVLPRDLTTLTDPQFRQLHSEYTAALARLNYIVSIEAADEYAAKVISEKLYARALATIEPEVKMTVPQREAAAANDPEVVEWKERYHEHHTKASIYRAMRDGAKDTAERLSREWTMRQDERTFGATT